MSQASDAPPVSKGRRTAFIVLTVLFGLGLGLGAFAFLALVAAWFGVGDREVHIVHDLAWGAHGGLLLAIPFLIQAVNPERKPAVMLGAALAGLALAVGYALSGVWLFVPVPIVIVGLLCWLHPARGDILPRGSRARTVAAVLAVVALTPFLVTYAFDEAAIQRACPPSGDQHCEEFHFAGMAALAFALPLVGLGASLRTRGSRIVAWLVGAASVVFGLSGVLYPDNLSSIGTRWGWAAVAAGVLFVAVAEWARRREQASIESST